MKDPEELKKFSKVIEEINISYETEQVLAEDDFQILLKDYKERSKFLNTLVDKIVICDPLDRLGDPDKYPAMDNESALTVAQLKDRIFEHAFFEGGNSLQAALPKEVYSEFSSWINAEREKINKVGEDYIKGIKKHRSSFEGKFIDLPKVKFLKETLEFFSNHKLLVSIDEDVENFNEYITDTQQAADDILS